MAAKRSHSDITYFTINLFKARSYAPEHFCQKTWSESLSLKSLNYSKINLGAESTQIVLILLRVK